VIDRQLQQADNNTGVLRLSDDIIQPINKSRNNYNKEYLLGKLGKH
jgi:hypothetical protein